MDHRRLTARLSAAVSQFALVAAVLALPISVASGQVYSSSVVGTEYDFITDSDPSAFLCLEFKGKGNREMPDKRGPSSLIQSAYIFMAYFKDGTSVDLGLDEDFANEEVAHQDALRYAVRLGKLPTALRRGVKRVVVHTEGEDTTAFSDEGLIVLYSANATKRIGTHDLEETIFHESVHAAWDKTHADSPAWRKAQADDGGFVTHYARKNPDGEDLAESALFAYTLTHHPERIPPESAAKINAAIPARIAFVRSLSPPGKPILEQVGPVYACDGSGTTFTVSEERAQAQRLEPVVVAEQRNVCTVDLSTVVGLSDILSNALGRGLNRNPDEVRTFLKAAKADRNLISGEDLVDAAVARFGLGKERITAAVEKYRHCNCEHGELTEVAYPLKAGVPETARSAAAVGQPSKGAEDAARLRTLLSVIAVLLALLLLVNVTSLVVNLRKGKATP